MKNSKDINPLADAGVLIERARHMYENWSLGSKGPSILVELASALSSSKAEIAELRAKLDEARAGTTDAAKALDALALRWAVKSWMTKDFPQQACEEFKHDVLSTYVSLARPYLNRAESAEQEMAEMRATREMWAKNALDNDDCRIAWQARAEAAEQALEAAAAENAELHAIMTVRSGNEIDAIHALETEIATLRAKLNAINRYFANYIAITDEKIDGGLSG